MWSAKQRVWEWRMPFRRTARSKVVGPKPVVGARKPLRRPRTQKEWPRDLSDGGGGEEDLFWTTGTMDLKKNGEQTEGKGSSRNPKKQVPHCKRNPQGAPRFVDLKNLHTRNFLFFILGTYY